MRKVHSLAEVDQNKCIGDRVCENVCPTAAIRMVEKKAVVDAERCAACLKCVDYCAEGAIRMVSRSEPLLLTVDPSSVDQDQLRELCRRAHLDPEDIICPCTSTKASEVAAAILKGAETPDDVSAVTGIRTACGMWCMALIQELLRAYGLQTPPPRGFRWYPVKAALWNIPDDVIRKYPEYRLEQARERFRAGAGHGAR